MKNVSRLSERLASVAIAGLMLITIAAGMMGCGDAEDPLDAPTALTKDTQTGVFAQEKYGDGISAAPLAPQRAGTPFVKEVAFYRDWQLTKPIIEPVSVGTRVFIHVVFSESMRHVVSDGKEARPVLYHRRAGKEEALVRFRMAERNAGGNDFVAGDAKPFRTGTEDYVCKYRVLPEDAGKGIAIMVGKQSVDLEGNPLSAFYRHPTSLEVESHPEMEPVDPAANPMPAPFQHPMLVEEPVTHRYYHNDPKQVVSDVLPPSAWVLDFPGPYREYTPPRSGPRDFVGRVAMPVGDVDYDNWISMGGTAPVSGVVVTITRGPREGEWVLTDAGGYYLFRDIQDDELYLRVERAYLEPKEVIVSRSHPTVLQHIGPHRVLDPENHKQEKQPGTILMGLRWPEPVRFVLENETMLHDPLLVETPRISDQEALSGYYAHMVIYEANPSERRGNAERGALTYSTILHELAHARQHAVALLHGGDYIGHWDNTPEAKAYRAAWGKDLREIPGKGLYLVDQAGYTSLLENAAEFCDQYWSLGLGRDRYLARNIRGIEPIQDFRERAPNRFRWAETYLNTRY